jgi:hypothetical protein
MSGNRVLVGLAFVLMLAAAAPLAAQQKDAAWAMSQAPADACIVGSIRGFQELETALKELMGPDADEMPLVKSLEAAMPAGAFDTTGPGVFMVPICGADLKGVLLLRIKDESKIKGEAVEGGITKIEMPVPPAPPGAPEGFKMVTPTVYVLQMGPWAAVADEPEGLKAIAAATGRMSNLAGRGKDVADHSIWVCLNPKSLAAAGKEAVAKMQAGPAGGAPAMTGAPPKIIDWVIGLAGQVESLTASADIKAEGVTAAADLRLVEGSQLAAALAAAMPVQTMPGALPAGDQVLVAAWMRVDWAKAAQPMKALFRPLFDILTAGADEAGRKSIDDMWAMYDQFVGVMGDEVAVLMEVAPPGHGMYRLTETFAVKDPAKYRELMAKMMSASQEMMKATMGAVGGGPGGMNIKMNVDYKAGAETVEGLPVDVMKMQMEMQPPPDAPPQVKEQMKKMSDAMYGPEGMVMRMVVADQTAIVSMGDAADAARAVKAVRGQGPRLSTNAKVQAAIGRLPKGSCAAGVISIQNYLYMAMSMTVRMMGESMSAQVKALLEGAPPPMEPPAPSDLATFAAQVSGRTVHIDLAVPQSEVRGAAQVVKQFSRRMQWRMQKMMEEVQKQAQEQQQPGAAPPAGRK